MSKIQEAFPANGRVLFESERAVVEAFNEKYKHLSEQRQEAKNKMNRSALVTRQAQLKLEHSKNMKIRDNYRTPSDEYSLARLYCIELRTELMEIDRKLALAENMR